jgi:hypothetical protein
MFADFLKTVRTLKSQIQIIQGLNLSEEEKKLITTSLTKLDEDLLKTVESISILKDQVEIIKKLNLSEDEKKILATALDRLKALTNS